MVCKCVWCDQSGPATAMDVFQFLQLQGSSALPFFLGTKKVLVYYLLSFSKEGQPLPVWYTETAAYLPPAVTISLNAVMRRNKVKGLAQNETPRRLPQPSSSMGSVSSQDFFVCLQ